MLDGAPIHGSLSMSRRARRFVSLCSRVLLWAR